jgi:hypothetical protein
LLWLSRGPCGRSANALLQGVHEVDHLGAELRFLDRLRLPVLDLGLDQLAEGEVVLVLEGLGIKRLGFTLDELGRELQELLVRLHVRHLVEERLGLLQPSA